MKQCHLLRAAAWTRDGNRLKRNGADCVHGGIRVEIEIRRDVRRPTSTKIFAEFGADALAYDRGQAWFDLPGPHRRRSDAQSCRL